MPSPEDDDGLSPELKFRLRAAMNRVQPVHSSPRYVAVKPHQALLRLAPAALAASVVGILALSGYVGTGSANPVVWTEHVVTVVTQPRPAPTSAPAPEHHRSGPQAAPSEGSGHHDSPGPTEKPEPSESPEPAQSPESDKGDSGSGSGSGGSGSGHGGGGRSPQDDH